MNKPKKVLIIAASSDIGKHIVERFAKGGYELLLTSTDINHLKPISENVIKKYNVKKITSLNIVEGKNAVELYGNSGKKGVVVITTKGLSNKEKQELKEFSSGINH